MRANCSFVMVRGASRLALLVYDVLCLTLLAAIVLSGVPSLAFAYVDPSVMTYTIQAVAGVAVALSAVAGVAFRKSRKKIMQLLKIDENAKKVVDPSWSKVEGVKDNRYNDCGTEEYLSRVAVGASVDEREITKGEKTPLGHRVLLALVVSAFVVMTLLVIAPFEMLAGNEGSLVFGLTDAWQPIVFLALAVLAVLVVGLSIMRGRGFSCLSCFVSGWGVTCRLFSLMLVCLRPMAAQ